MDLDDQQGENARTQLTAFDSTVVIPTIIHHHYLFVPDQRKDAHIIYLAKQANEANETLLIFTTNFFETRRVTRMLEDLGVPALWLRAELPLLMQTSVLDQIRRKQCRILVMNDLWSALSAFPNVDRIVNFSLPSWITPGIYQRRVAHLGNGGGMKKAITLITQYDVERYEQVKKAVLVDLKEYEVDKHRVMCLHADVMWARSKDMTLVEVEPTKWPANVPKKA